MYKKDENGEFILDGNGNKILEEAPKSEGGDKTSAEKQVITLQGKIESLGKEVEHLQAEVERITFSRDSILDEKRKETEKYRSLKESLDGMSVEDVKTAIESAKRDGKDRDEELRTILSAREKTLREDLVVPLEKDNSELRKTNENLRGKLARNIVESEITQEAIKFGARPDALRIISQDFSGRIAVDENGDKYYVDKQGVRTDSLSYESEFIKHRSENPFLYNENAGTSARSNSNFDPSSKQENPWSEKNYSLTEQFRIERESPELAEKLKKEAK